MSHNIEVFNFNFISELNCQTLKAYGIVTSTTKELVAWPLPVGTLNLIPTVNNRFCIGTIGSLAECTDVTRYISVP